VIVVDSVANDWIQVGSFCFSPYVTSLKTYALQGPSTIAAWILNRNVNFQNTDAKAASKAVEGTVHFTGITRNGTWELQWYDTLSGALAGTATALAVNGGLDVLVPPTAWDWALKMTNAGEAKPVGPAAATPSAVQKKSSAKPALSRTLPAKKTPPKQSPPLKKPAIAPTTVLKKGAPLMIPVKTKKAQPTSTPLPISKPQTPQT